MYCPSCGHLNLPGADNCAACLLDLAALDRPVPQDKVESSLMADAVAVLGPRPPVTVPIDGTLGDAVHHLLDRGVGAVLVTTPSGRLVGILTERDFLTKVAGDPGFTSHPVREYMTADPETVAPTDKLAIALQRMDVGGYRHLPVVEAGKPVGVVSVRDVLRHVTRLCKDG
jgi:CBS domain-containing protein